MKVTQWQGQWRQQQIEVQILPRLMLSEVRLLVDGEERDRSVLFRTFKAHQLRALARPESHQGLIDVQTDGNALYVAVDGEALTGQAMTLQTPSALANGLFCALGFFVFTSLFMLLFNVVAQGLPLRQLPSMTPPLVLAVVMGLYYFIDTKKRQRFRDTLAGQ